MIPLLIRESFSRFKNPTDRVLESLGAFCESPGESYDGQLCAFNTSTCGGTVEDCHGRYSFGYSYYNISNRYQLFSGPGFRISDFASNEIIGQLQMEGAQTVMNSDNRTTVSGSVRSVHIYMDM